MGKGHGNSSGSGQVIIPPWIKFSVALGVLAVAIYTGWQRNYGGGLPKPGPAPSTEPAPTSTPAPEAPTPISESPAPRPADPPPKVAAPSETPSVAANIRTTIPDQTILAESGDEVFRGTVDVGPTLARIQVGERLRFPNDGSTFQNREGRLPRKPAGYYKEYVHPTPGLSGPGPQRIVIGEGGETYYTADHYRTFKRLDE